MLRNVFQPSFGLEKSYRMYNFSCIAFLNLCVNMYVPGYIVLVICYNLYYSLISQFFSSFDSVKILPVPKPIGGILVFSVNALFFLNQGIPPYAVSLNSLGDTAMEGIARKFFHSMMQAKKVHTPPASIVMITNQF